MKVGKPTRITEGCNGATLHHLQSCICFTGGFDCQKKMRLIDKKCGMLRGCTRNECRQTEAQNAMKHVRFCVGVSVSSYDISVFYHMCVWQCAYEGGCMCVTCMHVRDMYACAWHVHIYIYICTNIYIYICRNMEVVIYRCIFWFDLLLWLESVV